MQNTTLDQDTLDKTWNAAVEAVREAAKITLETFAYDQFQEIAAEADLKDPRIVALLEKGLGKLEPKILAALDTLIKSQGQNIHQALQYELALDVPARA